MVSFFPGRPTAMFQGMEVTAFMGMYEDAKLHISWSVQGPLTA